MAGKTTNERTEGMADASMAYGTGCRDVLAERVRNDFAYHPARGNQGRIYEANRTLLMAAALELVERCPYSRELSLALEHLEEAMFWANAAIARWRSEKFLDA